MWALFVTAAVAVLLLALICLRIYAAPGTPWFVSAIVCTGWLFSLSIVVLLPSDVSTTLGVRRGAVPTDDVDPHTTYSLWETLYWVTFTLTWLVIPLLQSYVMAGEFTVFSRVRAALRENLIFYGVIGLLFVGFVVYIGIVNRLDGTGIIGFALAASNAWGLFLLISMMGYGLVEIPRRLWLSADHNMALKHCEFRATILANRVDETAMELGGVVQRVGEVDDVIPFHDELRSWVDAMVEKCPVDDRRTDAHAAAASADRELGGAEEDGEEADDVTPKGLAKLNRRLTRALWASGVARRQFQQLLDEAFRLQDTIESATSYDREYTRSFVDNSRRPHWRRRAEFLWRVVVVPPVARAMGVLAAVLTLGVLWSEATMFVSIDLSLWSLVIHAPGASPTFVQLVVLVLVAYVCACALYGLFKLRLFSYYRLQSHRQSDANSLLFSAAYACRLAAPICFNVLNVLHEGDDSRPVVVPVFLKVVGVMDVVPFFGSAFNMYFPAFVLLLCLATFFNLYSRALSAVGISRFRFDESDFEHDLVDSGRELIDKERERRLRALSREERQATLQSGLRDAQRKRAADDPSTPFASLT